MSNATTPAISMIVHNGNTQNEDLSVMIVPPVPYETPVEIVYRPNELTFLMSSVNDLVESGRILLRGSESFIS